MYNYDDDTFSTFYSSVWLPALRFTKTRKILKPY